MGRRRKEERGGNNDQSKWDPENCKWSFVVCLLLLLPPTVAGKGRKGLRERSILLSSSLLATAEWPQVMRGKALGKKTTRGMEFNAVLKLEV